MAERRGMILFGIGRILRGRTFGAPAAIDRARTASRAAGRRRRDRDAAGRREAAACGGRPARSPSACGGSTVRRRAQASASFTDSNGSSSRSVLQVGGGRTISSRSACAIASAGRRPDAVRGLGVVVRRRLVRRHARHEEAGVELTGVDRRRHPVREQHERVERQAQALALDHRAQRAWRRRARGCDPA